MVLRPAIRTFLLRSSSSTTRRRGIPHNSPPPAPPTHPVNPLQRLRSPDGSASSGFLGGATAAVPSEFLFSSHFPQSRRSDYFHAASSLDDDEERSKRGAACPGSSPKPFAEWGEAWNSSAAAKKEEKIRGNAQQRKGLNAVVGLAERGGRFSASSIGSPVSTGEVLGRIHGFGNGPSQRLYSSAAAAAASEGTQIRVDGNQLDSLQAAITGAGGAESAAASIPHSDALSEVAVAAADCSVPTAFVQYVIDGVHVSTGFPWWASIVATTVAIRFLVLPIMIYQMKATARLTLLRPELEKLTNRIKESNYDPKVVEDNQVRMKALFVKYKTTPFSPILGAFVQAPIFMCFFFGIRNMAEKVPSFKEGGMWWFTDLSTPDSLFIMPVLSGAFFLLTVELGAADGMQGQPMMAKMKNFMRGLSILLVPLTASFPKALFCYWLTANVFSLVQAGVLKRPGVKSVLGIPDVSHLAKPADVPIEPMITYSQPPRLRGETRAKRRKS